MKILVSACLIGENCKYNGGNNLCKGLEEELYGFEFVPVCPESLGGLPIPRSPSERRGDRVVSAQENDVTESFRKGAEAALKTALDNGIRFAILKERSPSCGKNEIYDGSFSGKKKAGAGVTAELLIRNGVEVFSEEELARFKERIKMRETTLCYIEKDDRVLLLYRNKKENDYNAGKWIGVGGKFEEGETPEECLLREVFEETGLRLRSYKKRGLVFFSQNGYEEVMHLYTADCFSGEIKPCDEGELKWIDKKDILTLPTWEGDREFLKLLYERKNTPFFIMKLCYDGDRLQSVYVEGV